jgi:hypothetical protein
MPASLHSRGRTLMPTVFILMVYTRLILMVELRSHISSVVLWCNVGDAHLVSVTDNACEISN